MTEKSHEQAITQIIDQAADRFSKIGMAQGFAGAARMCLEANETLDMLELAQMLECMALICAAEADIAISSEAQGND